MPDDGSRILFDRCPKDLDRKRLRAFHQTLEEQIAAGSRFNCLVTNDRRLRKLNREFLQHDYATDVLSFPCEGEPGLPQGQREMIGELAISIERAAAQASLFGHSVEDEVQVLMLHGTLHLMGMDHERDGGKMARTESAWRRRLGLPATLIQRSKVKSR